MLDFPIEESPKWRYPSSSIGTCTMIKEISRFRKKFCDIEEVKVFCEDVFIPDITADFIYAVNIGEQVGTQTKAETEEVLRVSNNSNFVMPSQDDKTKETVNIYKAIRRLDEVFVEMEGTGLLTVPQVCKVHEILMKGLRRDAGRIRGNEAFTTWNNQRHYYPPPESVENRLYSHIDHHNDYMNALPPKYSIEETEYVIKCAARLMFEFVNTHPFGDGNGRTCRLLANHVLAMITPFPVYIYHNNTSEGIRREDYINAIVQCRDNPKEGPREIAAMLAEGVWNGWKGLLQSHNLEAGC